MVGEGLLQRSIPLSRFVFLVRASSFSSSEMATTTSCCFLGGIVLIEVGVSE